MTGFASKIFSYCETEHLLQGKKRLLAAFSGGADSMALLLCMKEICDEKNGAYELGAVHINHMIRRESADEEIFVREFCEKNGIKLFVERADVPKYAAENKIGLEEAARKERYRILKEIAEINSYDVIMTAHNKQDNAETLILNLIRGTGIDGLFIPSENGRIIRPLLCSTRDEIIAYLGKLDFVVDSSNFDDYYTRNYIRHEILPRLLQKNTAFLESAFRLSQNARRDSDFLEKKADTFFNSCASFRENGSIVIPCAQIAPQHGAVMSRVVRKAFNLLTGEALDFANTQLICSLIQKSPPNVHLFRTLPLKVIFRMRYGKIEFSLEQQSICRDNCGNYVMKYENFDENSDKTAFVHDLDTICSFDSDKISGAVLFRHRLPGDAIKLPGRPRKTLKKLLNEMQIPREQRDFVTVAADDNGVFWCDVCGCDERVETTDVTQNTAKIMLNKKSIGVQNNDV